ncbi:hypothetical protein DVS28_a0749 [Euzebya pacifica]|uniref:Uncharacterized protein n=2 Tax=Euzebya pacifica TaxID=1608957 RepID=A0A346XTA3_9ACTN|nr:hypothetical protein DVS28_a0749 [Euzebya pacifica]
MDLDNVAGNLEARDQPGRSGGKGRPVPADNRQGHHPAHEQDKPDLDKFAAKFGLVDETVDETVDEESSPDAVRTHAASSSAARSSSTPPSSLGLLNEGAKVIASLQNAGRAATAASLALTARTMRLAADLVDRLGDDVAPRGA